MLMAWIGSAARWSRNQTKALPMSFDKDIAQVAWWLNVSAALVLLNSRLKMFILLYKISYLQPGCHPKSLRFYHADNIQWMFIRHYLSGCWRICSKCCRCHGQFRLISVKIPARQRAKSSMAEWQARHSAPSFCRVCRRARYTTKSAAGGLGLALAKRIPLSFITRQCIYAKIIWQSWHHLRIELKGPRFGGSIFGLLPLPIDKMHSLAARQISLFERARLKSEINCHNQ